MPEGETYAVHGGGGAASGVGGSGGAGGGAGGTGGWSTGGGDDARWRELEARVSALEQATIAELAEAASKPPLPAWPEPEESGLPIWLAVALLAILAAYILTVVF